MYTPVNPSFTIYKWGVRGSSLHGNVFVMRNQIVSEASLGERLHKVLGQIGWALVLNSNCVTAAVVVPFCSHKT